MGNGRAPVALVLLVVLAGCTSQDEPPAAAPRPIPVVHGEPGRAVTLEHEAEAGEVLQVFVQPLPLTQCAQTFTLGRPDGEDVALTTLDAATRLDEAGTWSWTYEPCPGDEASYDLRAVPMRGHALELDGPPVTLAVHATFNETATFVPPAAGRAILLGAHRGLVGPDGATVQGYSSRVVFDDGLLVAPVAPAERGRFTVLGDGADVRLVTPPTFDAEVGGAPVALGPAGGWEVGEYAVEFSVDEDTWLSTRLLGWEVTHEAPAAVDVVPLDGQPDPTRAGGPWHLTPGAYVARVTPVEAGAHGSLELVPVTPDRVDRPGEIELTAAPGAPGLALYDLTGDHLIDVVGADASEQGWTLTWSADEPPKECSSALSCMAAIAPSLPHLARLDPRISGRGYLALTATDGATHEVTVRIGNH